MGANYLILFYSYFYMVSRKFDMIMYLVLNIRRFEFGTCNYILTYIKKLLRLF